MLLLFSPLILIRQRYEQRYPSNLSIGVTVPKVGDVTAGEPYSPAPERLTLSFARTGSRSGDLLVDDAHHTS